MYSWVEMGHTISSLYHKSLHHKTKDIVIHMPDEDLVIYEKLRYGLEKKMRGKKRLNITRILKSPNKWDL